MPSLSILFDARPLTDPMSGGVRRVSAMILEALLASELAATFTCVTTGIRKPTLPEPFASHPRVTHIHVRMPNKLWSLLAMFGIVSLDRAVGKKSTENERDGKWKMENGKWTDRIRPDHFPFPLFHFPSNKSHASIPRLRSGQAPRRIHASILPNLGFVGFMETPYALVLHDLSFLIEPKWFPLKMRLWHIAVNPKEIARRAQLILCVSETTARDAARLLKIPREKIRVFNPGIPPLHHEEVASHPPSLKLRGADESRVTSSEQTDPQTHDSRLVTRDWTRVALPFLLAFSERDPRKNIATAIAAVEDVRRDEAYRDLKLVIAGSGDNHESRVTSHEFITRLPKVSDAELADLYRDASALLYPSWYEGFGLPLHEAARYGVPCIASTMGSLPETAPQGTIFAPPSKPHLWASMIRDVLAAPDRYRTTFDEPITKTDVTAIVEWLRRVDR